MLNIICPCNRHFFFGASQHPIIIGHYSPMFLYEYTTKWNFTSCIPVRIGSELEVMHHVCIICQTTLYCHVSLKRTNFFKNPIISSWARLSPIFLKEISYFFLCGRLGVSLFNIALSLTRSGTCDPSCTNVSFYSRCFNLEWRGENWKKKKNSWFWFVLVMTSWKGHVFWLHRCFSSPDSSLSSNPIPQPFSSFFF